MFLPPHGRTVAGHRARAVDGPAQPPRRGRDRYRRRCAEARPTPEHRNIDRGGIPMTSLGMLIPLALVGAAIAVGGPQSLHIQESAASAGYEVWVIDQSDTTAEGGGTLYIYDGDAVTGDDPTGAAEVVDLGGDAERLCLEQTGSVPKRPHMFEFNAANTHAVLAYVATGHVLFLDAADAHAAGLPRRRRAGPRRLPLPRRALRRRGEPERQAAAAHQHRLRGQHVHAGRGGHAQPGDLHHAQRRPVRGADTAARTSPPSARSSTPAAGLRPSPCAAAGSSSSTARRRRWPSSPSTTRRR